MENTNIDFVLDHRNVILSAYNAAGGSPSLTWQMLTGLHHKSGEKIGDGTGTLMNLPEIMKYDSFRTYLPMLESLGKRLDPGQIAETIDKRLSAMEDRIVSELEKRIDEKISKLFSSIDERFSDYIKGMETLLSPGIEPAASVSFKIPVCDFESGSHSDTQPTEPDTQLTQIAQRLDNIEDSIESSKLWWTELEKHVRGLSSDNFEKIEGKIVALDRMIGEVAKESDSALNMGRKQSENYVSLQKQTDLITLKIVSNSDEIAELRKQSAEKAEKYEKAKTIIQTMSDAPLPFFEENIASLRKQREMSQEQLAEFLGVSRNKVANWEAGRTPIPPDVIRKLSKEGQ